MYINTRKIVLTIVGLLSGGGVRGDWPRKMFTPPQEKL